MKFVKKIKVSIIELAALVNKLGPNEKLVFNASENDDLEYGIVLITVFDFYVLLVNCVGGGCPLVIDVTVYDEDLGLITEKLTEYIRELDTPYSGFVYVKEK